jgi:hypothetical protein
MGSPLFLLVYVDDILIVGKFPEGCDLGGQRHPVRL